MARKKISTDTKVQAILHAEVHGDESAVKTYKITAQSLGNWRRDAKKEGSDIFKLFQSYAAALDPTRKAPDFAGWLLEQVRDVSEIIKAKAKDINAQNPEGLRALNEHTQTLLEHAAALQYIAGLFPQAEPSGNDPSEVDE